MKNNECGAFILSETKNGERIVSKIPYRDTKNYVEKVTKTYNMYVRLYK